MRHHAAELLVQLGHNTVVQLIANDVITTMSKSDVLTNWEHIRAFAEVGEYQVKEEHQWITRKNICFDLRNGSYRPVPPKEINWEKALENAAYGKTFEFSDCKDFSTWLTTSLLGYDQGERSYPFIVPNNEFKYCRVPIGFKIPESWYD